MTETLHFHPAPDAGVGELSQVLQATLPLLSQLLEAVPARIVVLDVQERFVWAHHEFFKFTGMHPKQALGQPIGQPIGRIVGGHACASLRRARPPDQRRDRGLGGLDKPFSKTELLARVAALLTP